MRAASLPCGGKFRKLVATSLAATLHIETGLGAMAQEPKPGVLRRLQAQATSPCRLQSFWRLNHRGHTHGPKPSGRGVCRVPTMRPSERNKTRSAFWRWLKIVSDEQGGGLVAEGDRGRPRLRFRFFRSKPVVGSSRMMMGGLADGGARAKSRTRWALTAGQGSTAFAEKPCRTAVAKCIMKS